MPASSSPLAAVGRAAEPAPWWRYGMVWFVLAGPAAVVVAGIATAVIAIRGADPVVAAPTVRTAKADAPAVQARNHAAAAEPAGR